MKQPDLILFAPNPESPNRDFHNHCSPGQAAQIVAAMIRATVEIATSFWPGDVYLASAPGTEHALFHQLADEYHIGLTPQGPGDRGERTCRALESGIARNGAAAVMNCDAPHCRWDTLEAAHDHLARGRNVIGPTSHGDFYLIGVQHAAPELFRNVNWDGPDILLRTSANAAGLGLSLELLPIMQNVDTWDDLLAVARNFEPLRLAMVDRA